MGSIMEMGGDKANRARAKVRNAETSITILKGAPMFYNMNGTSDGIDAISSEAIPAAKQGFFAGIALQDIAPGKIRESLVSGVCEFARILTASRAATTDAWASYAAGATGDILSFLSGAGLQAFARSAAGSASNQFWVAQLVGTFASATTQASSVGSATFSASTWSTTTAKVFLRGL